jgi:hypothetical protein
VVVVAALVQLVDRLAGLEMLARKQPRVLELGQHAVHRGEPDIESLGEERPVDVLGGEMAHLARFEELEDPAPWQRCLEAAVLEALRAIHSANIIGG